VATRKTHIVRIKHPTDEDIWMDIEVLDAVGFRTDNGNEMVLSVDAKKARVNIKDDTGDGNAKPGGSHATRRSHMKKLSGDNGQTFDFEILDGLAFRDQNNDEWVLSNEDKGSLNVYNVTTKTGNSKSTRRVHNEKVYSDPKDKSSPYLMVERCDTMVFRGPNNREMVIKMPSYDDGNGERASSFTTPRDYKPGETTPPDNSDPSVYAFIPKASQGCATGGKADNAMKCGPLWWPRAINKKAGPWYWYVPTQVAMQYSILFHNGKYQFIKNPSVSSWSGRRGSWELVYAPGIYLQSLDGEQTTFIPFQPFGFGSLELAIEGGGIGNDWGLIDFSDTRIDGSQEDGLNKDPCIPGVKGSPDIWQLTGIAAPALVKPVPPNKKWLPGPVSSKLAAQAANAWLSDWQQTSASFNNAKAGDCGNYTIKDVYIHWPPTTDEGATQRFIEGLEDKRMAYPGTAFSVPIWDMTVNPPLTGGRYIGGIPPDFWSNTGSTTIPGAPDSVISLLGQGHYASQLSGGQLDPNKWDTSDPTNPKRKGSSA